MMEMMTSIGSHVRNSVTLRYRIRGIELVLRSGMDFIVPFAVELVGKDVEVVDFGVRDFAPLG